MKWICLKADMFTVAVLKNSIKSDPGSVCPWTKSAVSFNFWCDRGVVKDLVKPATRVFL